MKKPSRLLTIVSLMAVTLSGVLALAVNPVEKKLMDDARSAYESGKLEKAMELYGKIPQNSDYWVESMEERAWTSLRKGDNNHALSLITTLTSDFLAPQVGPEPYFLRALIDYRLCNIKGIFQDFDLFKKRFKTRSEELEKLKSSNANLGTAKALEVLRANKATLTKLKADDFGSEIQYLPQFFYRDRTILAAAESGSDRRIQQRLGQLAEDEAKEIELILQKMHLLESQVVQQVFAYNKQMHEKRDVEFSKRDKNSLVFPYKPNSDIWLDEIDSFEAATSDCPVDTLQGVTL